MAATPTSPNPGPTIDVIVSTFNEERYIGRCLDQVLGQDYPAGLVKVWLVDGGSTDGTLDIVRRRAREEPSLELIESERRINLPEALNVGIERSSGDLVAKVDAHGYPELDFLRRAVEAFNSEGPDVACVGGRPEQEGETRFGRAVALARGSRFGVGGSVYAGTSQREFVDTVQCGVYRRGPLEAVGSFDPVMNYGEDEEVNWRLRRAGHRILLDTSIRFHYVTRPSWSAVYRQYRNYGEARVRVVTAHPDYLRPRHLAPAAFVAGLGGLAVATPFSAAARAALIGAVGLYGGAAVAVGAGAARKHDPSLTPAVASCFAALHFGYGIGMLQALVARTRPL